MKIKVGMDELFPFFELRSDEELGTEIELTDTDIRDYKSTMSAFYSWQGKLGKLSGYDRFSGYDK